MNNKIYIDIGTIDQSITKLKSLKKRLEAVKDLQSSHVKELSSIWNGTTGNELNRVLSTHLSDYNSFIDSLDARIKFLETVKNSYSTMDSNISNKVDSNTK